MVTRETLDTIRIVYCAPYSLALYGIPYEMRRDVGQAPRHLWQAAHDRPRGMSSHVNPVAESLPRARTCRGVVMPGETAIRRVC